MQLDIHVAERRLALGIREFVERRIRFALTRFAPRIRQITVSLRDVNGPRTADDKTADDKRCRIEVALLPTGLVLVQDTDSDWLTAIGRCAERVGRAVGRELERRRERRE